MTFVVVEGIDGAGKTTVIESLRRAFSERAHAVTVLREPGSTPLGEKVRSILLDPATGGLEPWAEVCLFSACRAQMVAHVIRPALERGQVVILDRYFYSTVAYQAHGAGLLPAPVQELSRHVTGGLLPDIVLLLDLPVEIAMARRRGKPDRMEAKGGKFLDRVRQGFLTLARDDATRWHVLDASLDPSVIATLAWTTIGSRGLDHATPPATPESDAGPPRRHPGVAS